MQFVIEYATNINLTNLFIYVPVCTLACVSSHYFNKFIKTLMQKL